MSTHIFASIAAVAQNGAIGRNNDLVWRNKEDLAHFKELTINHAIIMGQKTFASLDCVPLPNRMNIVLTQDTTKLSRHANMVYLHDMDLACEWAKEYSKRHEKNQAFFIGGAFVYQQAFKYISRMYLTEINKTFDDADTFFPAYDKTEWQETNRDNRGEFDFVIYDKKL